MTTDDAARRSEGRERRRAASADRNGHDEGGDSRSSSGGLEGAARAAAAAAAVGAALGAVKALAQRDDRGDEHDNRHEDERDEHAQTAVADEPSDEHGADAADADDDREQPPGGGAEQEQAPEQQEHEEPRAPRAEIRNDDRGSRPREGASAGTVKSIAARAREQLRELQGRDAESITALERSRDGWSVTCEVLEVERVPDSTDVLATYVIELDSDGELIAFERVRRYYRAQADHGGDR
jgi:hypothetical protein